MIRKYLKPIITLLAAISFYVTFGYLFPRITGIPEAAEAISPTARAVVAVVTGGLIILAIVEFSKISRD